MMLAPTGGPLAQDQAGGQPGPGPPPQLPSATDGHVHGRDTADLFHYFNQAGALAPSVSGLVTAPLRCY